MSNQEKEEEEKNGGKYVYLYDTVRFLFCCCSLCVGVYNVSCVTWKCRQSQCQVNRNFVAVGAFNFFATRVKMPQDNFFPLFWVHMHIRSCVCVCVSELYAVYYTAGIHQHYVFLSSVFFLLSLAHFHAWCSGSTLLGSLSIAQFVRNFTL